MDAKKYAGRPMVNDVARRDVCNGDWETTRSLSL